LTKKVRKLRNTPFDDVFRTLLEKCSKLIIPVINEILHTDYTFKDEILVLANEQYFSDEEGNEMKKITDSYLKLRDNIYHIECQSTDDTYMEIRMMEYDFHIALDNVTINDGVRVVELPQSAVLVVKNDSNFPDYLTSIIRVPRYNQNGTTFDDVKYQVPTCKITNYTKDDIIKKNLIFLAPYYIIKFKKRLDEINNSKEQLDVLVAEYQDIYIKMAELSEQNELEDSYLHDIVSLTERLIDVVAKGKENIKREVNSMGGNVLKLDREILIEESEARGEEKMSKLICKLHKEGLSDDILRVSTDKTYRKEMYEKYNIQ